LKTRTAFLKFGLQQAVIFLGYSAFSTGKYSGVGQTDFKRKTQKTPKHEIEKALKIREEYKNEKQ